MSITIIFIIITVVASIYAWKNPDVYAKWIFNPYRINHNKEYHRFLTSGFIHADYVHLFFNMLALYFFGSIVEHELAKYLNDSVAITFIALYILGIFASKIQNYFKHKNNPGYNALGASGGVSAVLFSSIMFNPVKEICLYYVLCLPGFILGIIYLIYSYYQGKAGRDNIGHDAHLAGALFGLIFTIIIVPDIFKIFWEILSNWQPNFF